MNTESIRIEFDASGHLHESDLLLALEGELSEQDAARVEIHMRTCAVCQERRSEVEAGLAVYEEYRATVFLPEFQVAPHTINESPAFLHHLAGGNTDRVASPTSTVTTRSSDMFRSWLFGKRTSIRWVTVTAGLTAVAVFVSQVLLSPARLSAAELLERASTSQRLSTAAPPPVKDKSRIVLQRVRISSGGASVIREFQWTVGEPIPNSQWPNQEDPAEWAAPLTAEGFSQWRNSINLRNDKVTRSGDSWTLTTRDDDTTSGNFIRQAWLVVRASDFRPVSQHIRFADNRTLDFEEIALQVAGNQAIHEASETPNSNARPQRTDTTQPQVADPNEVELEVRYRMFQNEWDLGEDLEIASAGGLVTVSGVASSPERAGAIREVLGRIAGTQVAISAPPADATGNSPAGREAFSSPTPSALLKDALEKDLPVIEQRLDFVDRCLSGSDNALAHASALKRLAERYDANAEALLSPVSQKRLGEMLRGHSE